MQFWRLPIHSQRASTRISALLSEGRVLKSNVSRLLICPENRDYRHPSIRHGLACPATRRDRLCFPRTRQIRERTAPSRHHTPESGHPAPGQLAPKAGISAEISLIFQSRSFALWCQPVSITVATILTILVTTAKTVCCAATNTRPLT
jgi:hypothetical protein